MKATAININDVWYFISDQTSIVHSYYTKGYYLFKGQVTKEMSLRDISLGSQNYLVVGQSKQVYEGIPLFTPPWVEDILKLADDSCQYFKHRPGDSSYEDGLLDGFEKGYSIAKEKYKYTEKDMRDAIDIACERKYRTHQIMEIINQPHTYTVTYEIIDGIINILNAEKR